MLTSMTLPDTSPLNVSGTTPQTGMCTRCPSRSVLTMVRLHKMTNRLCETTCSDGEFCWGIWQSFTICCRLCSPYKCFISMFFLFFSFSCLPLHHILWYYATPLVQLFCTAWQTDSVWSPDPVWSPEISEWADIRCGLCCTYEPYVTWLLSSRSHDNTYALEVFSTVMVQIAHSSQTTKWDVLCLLWKGLKLGSSHSYHASSCG